jgi:hypothetical protein
MEIPRLTPAHRSSLDLPEIYIEGSNPTDRYRASSRSSNFSSRLSPTLPSAPMSIPHAAPPPPPPPLPPPRFPDLDTGACGEPDIAWRWSNSREETSWGRPSPSVVSGSSLYGSFRSHEKGIHIDPLEHGRRGSSASTIKSIPGPVDEGYASLSSTSIGSNMLVKSFRLSFSSKSR